MLWENELKPGKRTLLIGTLTLLVLLSFHVEDTSAKLWVIHDIDDRETYILKPVDPVFINKDDSEIHIKIGEEWSLFYPLEAEKRYHIFLVGDWINNGSDPLADYDISVYDPYRRWRSSHTESAGLPEQVANDSRHRYFVPKVTGDYEFRIVNDPRDSKNATSAVFMVIEHIDTNVKYSKYLEGRNTQTDEELQLTGWAYEFNTSSPRIRVFVDVPSSLDMYEARLYAMANPKEKIGYNLYGIGVPNGDLFDEFQGYYGGFNTSCKGDRNPMAMASCEYSGEDMSFSYSTPSTGENATNIFYYFVLIAEHGTGTVGFHVKTDFTPPNITLVEPPEKGYAHERTPLAVSIDEESEVERVWVEFTDDGGKTWETEDLDLEEDVYACDLPRFSAGANVNYTVHAEDAVGNLGSIDGSFPVKNRVALECRVAESTVNAGRDVDVSGRISPRSETVQLQFRNGDLEETVEVTTDTSGYFTYSYNPVGPGERTLQAFFAGDELNYPASSNVVELKVDLQVMEMSYSLSASEAKLNQPITFSGMLTPRVRNMVVEVTFTSSASYYKETVTTDDGGDFTCTFYPSVVGVWNVLAEVKGDGVQYTSSQSGLMEFIIVPLTVTDKASNMLLAMVRPPLQYLTIGAVGVGTSLAVYVGRFRLGIRGNGGKKRPAKKTKKYSRNKK